MRDPRTFSLVSRAQRGDEGAWAALVQREHRRLIGILAAILRGLPDRADRIEDLLQEVHLEAFRKISVFEDRGPGAFGRWLAGIARRKALANLRAAGRRRGWQRLSDTRAPSVPSLRTTPSAAAVREELASRVVRALDALPDDYRQVILLRHFEGLSSAEAGRVLGRTEGAVRVLFYRALARLGRALRAEEAPA